MSTFSSLMVLKALEKSKNTNSGRVASSRFVKSVEEQIKLISFVYTPSAVVACNVLHSPPSLCGVVMLQPSFCNHPLPVAVPFSTHVAPPPFFLHL